MTVGRLERTPGAQPMSAINVPPLVDVMLVLDDLARQLTQAATGNPDTEVQLRADDAVPYGRVVEVLGVAQKAGLSRIGFVAEPAPAQSATLPARSPAR